MSSEPVIRRFRTGDREACRSLWAELTSWHRRLYADPAIGGEDPGRHFDAHLTELGAERIWVAEIDGRVVGLAGMVPRDDNVELEPLAISAAYRGRGIGRRLAEAVIAAAREQGARQVRVRPTGRNSEAVRFLHGLGFDVIGRLELVLSLVPEEQKRWRDGEHIAGRAFRT
jgi:N-acetylglutamate synthase-like GNAT family acetyltransferase